jgi:DNA-binding Lrp family transcriptional regulator
MSVRRVKGVYGVVNHNSISKKQKFESKLPEYKVMNGKPWVFYGDKNNYPTYLLEMYQRSAKHNAIINGKVNYITGKGWTYDPKELTGELLNDLKKLLDNPNPYDDLNDILYKVSLDFEIFNGFALEIIWNLQGKISQIAHVNFGNLRVSEKQDKFYFAQEWKEYGDPEGLVEYMPFNPEKKLGKQLFYYSSYAPSVKYYPIPEYLGAMAYIETDARIANYHVNNLRNGFLGGYMFSFNNGLPTDEEQREIKRHLVNQMKGDDGERIVVAFNDNKENGLEITPLQANDLDKQFDILNSTIQQEIFVAHRVTSPMLFGIRTSGQLGGRSELIESYELFKSVYVEDRVRKIEKIFNYILDFNGVGVLEITPTDPIKDQLSEQTLTTIASRAELRELAGLKDDTIGVPKTTDSIQALSPLVANKVLEKLSEVEIRSLVGLPPKEQSLLTPPENTSTSFHGFGRDEKVELQFFNDYGRDRNEFIELKSRTMRYGFELMEQEFVSEYENLDSDILKLIKKNPSITAKDIASELNKSLELISERITSLIDNKAINIRGALKELGETAKDFIKPDRPEGDRLVQVMYRYDVLPEYGPKKVIPGSREFCRKLIELNRYYTRDEINTISRIVGYSVWERRGGWMTLPETNTHLPSCRHSWFQVLVKPKV